MLNKILKNKRGSFAILIIIVIFIVALAVTAFTDIITQSYTLNEVQGIMDVSGINALQNSIDLNKLREEQLAIDNDNVADTNSGTLNISDYSSKIQNTYNNEINSRIKTNHNIVNIQAVKFNTDFTYDTWGFGTSTVKRPQIVLDATYKITVKASSKFDTITPIAKVLYSARRGTDFSVSYGGVSGDGNVELIVRSVTREVLR